MPEPKIIITRTDRQRLEHLLASAFTHAIEIRPHLEALRSALQNAEIIGSEEIPDSVITMNSTIGLYDIDYDVTDTYTLVFPQEADILENKVSVLSPMGTAILGYRVGDVVTWRNSSGTRKLRLMELVYQPEREGAMHL